MYVCAWYISLYKVIVAKMHKDIELSKKKTKLCIFRFDSKICKSIRVS